MTITLPDEMRDQLEREAKAAGFATVDDYVADVLMDSGPVMVPEPTVGARYVVTTREELTAKLLEGMGTGHDEYAPSLVIDDGADDVATPDVPLSRLTPRNREELERMLDEGMNSGPVVEATPEFWEERRRELERRMAKRRGALL